MIIDRLDAICRQGDTTLLRKVEVDTFQVIGTKIEA